MTEGKYIITDAITLRLCRNRKSHRKSMALLVWLPLLFKVAARLNLLVN